MPDRPPNVVLFISDQQRWDTIAAGGVPDIQTPHLDWLAGDGVLFRRAYCAFPICGPSRMAMLSGLYPHTNGMVANQQMRPGCDLMRYPEGVRNLGNYLGDLGYRMGYAGKWHLGSGAGRPGSTEQKLQRRVQRSPSSMKVAVPREKHSPRLGQRASSQTVTRV